MDLHSMSVVGDVAFIRVPLGFGAATGTRRLKLAPHASTGGLYQCHSFFPTTQQWAQATGTVKSGSTPYSLESSFSTRDAGGASGAPIISERGIVGVHTGSFSARGCNVGTSLMFLNAPKRGTRGQETSNQTGRAVLDAVDIESLVGQEDLTDRSDFDYNIRGKSQWRCSRYNKGIQHTEHLFKTREEIQDEQEYYDTLEDLAIGSFDDEGGGFTNPHALWADLMDEVDERMHSYHTNISHGRSYPKRRHESSVPEKKTPEQTPTAEPTEDTPEEDDETPSTLHVHHPPVIDQESARIWKFVRALIPLVRAMDSEDETNKTETETPTPVVETPEATLELPKPTETKPLETDLPIEVQETESDQETDLPLQGEVPESEEESDLPHLGKVTESDYETEESDPSADGESETEDEKEEREAQPEENRISALLWGIIEQAKQALPRRESKYTNESSRPRKKSVEPSVVNKAPLPESKKAKRKSKAKAKPATPPILRCSECKKTKTSCECRTAITPESAQTSTVPTTANLPPGGQENQPTRQDFGTGGSKPSLNKGPQGPQKKKKRRSRVKKQNSSCETSPASTSVKPPTPKEKKQESASVPKPESLLSDQPQSSSPKSPSSPKTASPITTIGELQEQELNMSSILSGSKQEEENLRAELRQLQKSMSLAQKRLNSIQQ